MRLHSDGPSNERDRADASARSLFHLPFTVAAQRVFQTLYHILTQGGGFKNLYVIRILQGEELNAAWRDVERYLRPIVNGS